MEINHGNIGKCCNNNAKSAGGYQWKYNKGNKNDIDLIEIHKNQRNIKQYDMNRNYLKTWRSLSEITNKYGYASSNIAKCCNGKFHLPMDIYGNMQTKILLKECAEYGKKD